MSRGLALVGTSGWQYDHWKGLFYPSTLPKAQWFFYYAARFATVEVNNTFYRLPTAETFERWRGQAPSKFVYALKYSRFATHQKRLLEPDKHLEPFLSRARLLGDLLGPVLVQLPPTMRPNLPRLEAFLSKAPSDLRWAVEFRNTDWLSSDTLAILRRHGAALVVHDKIPGHVDEATADFVYYRFHGGSFDGGYDPGTLADGAKRMAAHTAAGRDVYAYFNNDQGGHAVHDARALMRLLAELNVKTGGVAVTAHGLAATEDVWPTLSARSTPRVRG
ncbi:DUF72 domain-containing protein [Desulfocurvibacter africanus]|uniref:DUF72 domain-containing protein n=1 Tax=Desulfocurvibacter africanus subsp. africanus str. Walvis Bay TaxID=690850 RepID=F3YUK5_DESAF|nr:DUF72 domain-containing protein [Desulfocurvibacter africanus]EGJ48959.1 protein of unknown function DUF72 [Desulfocurvibacter africanus subsp. africanus str. Walvis Bay]